MPQGVEHINATANGAGLVSVKIPLMPQGVEHSRAVSCECMTFVKIPLMPQGVEHLCRGINATRPASREDSIDAARR